MQLPSGRGANTYRRRLCASLAEEEEMSLQEKHTRLVYAILTLLRQYYGISEFTHRNPSRCHTVVLSSGVQEKA
jgi:sulfur relay (sulfurtransferase) DsrC/TusE family protein